MVSTTRPISCLTERSRSGDPTWPAEILRDDDVGRLLRPGLRHLDPALLENNGALFVADDRIAQFPFDLIERVGARGREESRKLEAGGGLRLAAACRLRGFVLPVDRTYRLSGRRGRQTFLSSAFLHASSSA